MEKEDKSPTVSLDVQYQIASTRRQGYDTLMWQTPVLSLTGLAFLFTIALSNGSSPIARIISGVLAFLSALFSAQLLAKHRYYEIYWAKWLQEFETEHKILPINNRPAPSKNRLICMSSYRLWMVLLLIYSVAALFIVILAVIELQSQ